MDVATAAVPRVGGLVDERFLMLEALGRGGMGVVYRVYDRAEQRVVALKVATDSSPAGPSHPLAAEFEAWSRLEHPNIVRAYELGVAASGPLPAGTPYLVLEHVAGGPAQHLLRPGGLDDGDAEHAAVQLLDALDHVHGAGWLHRDLKPANVLRSGRRLKLTDFGLAARLGARGRAGAISGSLPYVAPEALLGLPLDERADLYGLGILLFQLATGRLPFAGGGAREILRWHLCGPPADPRRVQPRLGARLARFIVRLTARDRSVRPATAEEARAMLGESTARSGVSHSRARVPVAGRAALATLRLALDAARVGSTRVIRLPASARARKALIAEAAIWAQVRGMSFHRLAGRAGQGRRSLARLALRVLAESSLAAVACARRHGLDHALPLRFVGSVAVIDAARLRPRGDAACRWADDARAIAEFLADRGDGRPAVLVLDGAAGRGELGSALAARLAAGDPPERGQGRGGLLVLLPPASVTPQAATRPRSAHRRRDAARAPTC